MNLIGDANSVFIAYAVVIGTSMLIIPFINLILRSVDMIRRYK